MRLKTLYFICILSCCLLGCTSTPENQSDTVQKEKTSLVDLVYPQLDTENSRWFLFSSASRPFGMVNLSPDTQLKGTWGSGYRYEIDTIKGFSHIHAWQLSGLSVMPVTLQKEDQNTIFSDYYSSFSHEKETVSPGYHSVYLDRYNIKAELTSTTRVGMHRYTYPKNTKKHILLNLNKVLGPCEVGNGYLKQTGISQLQGSFVIAPTKRRPKTNTVFFEIALNAPISNLKKDAATGNYEITLDGKSQTVLMKAGISYTTQENAKTNLITELPHWNFDQVVQESKDDWNTLLGRIEIEGGTKKAQRRFYTDLWHALQGRKIISDVNGAYPDNSQDSFRVGQLPLKKDGKPVFNHYNSDSFWGAQWTINTLWGLAYPDIKKEFALSLLHYEKDGGLIPRGPSGGNYTYVMTGATSTPFIVSAIQQNIITENLDSIYKALKKNHMPGGIMEKSGYEHNTNLGGGLSYYLKKGYVPYPIPEGKFGGHQDGASLTMEYAYQDFVLAQLAKKLKLKEDYAYFMKRAKNYKNVFDSETNWMRPKDSSGVWKKDFDPYSYENGFNESNGAQATWFVPHDLAGLAELMGGKDKALEKLNQQFIEAEKQGFTAGSSHDREMHPENSRVSINYGNQPSMQTAFIFHKLGRPDLTDYWSQKVTKSVFDDLSPSKGYNGDEDQGLMGSLAVLMKMGVFQMDGGTMDNPEYQISSPIFDKVTINLHTSFYSGAKFEIKSSNRSTENMYIKTLLLDGIPLKRFSLTHKEISNGGTLELKMGTSNLIK